MFVVKVLIPCTYIVHIIGNEYFLKSSVKTSHSEARILIVSRAFRAKWSVPVDYLTLRGLNRCTGYISKYNERTKTS